MMIAADGGKHLVKRALFHDQFAASPRRSAFGVDGGRRLHTRVATEHALSALIHDNGLTITRDGYAVLRDGHARSGFLHGDVECRAERGDGSASCLHDKRPRRVWRNLEPGLALQKR